MVATNSDAGFKNDSDIDSGINFEQRLVIEQLRAIETEQSLSYDIEESSVDISSHHDFESRLWLRTKYLIDRYDLASSLGHAAKLSRYANTAAMMLAVLLGILGITYAIVDVNPSAKTGSSTLNIYWLLLVLLGFNFISMLLWLIGISLNLKSLTSGMLARLAHWLPNYFSVHHNSADNNADSLADQAWLSCHFSGRVGKWQFSKITHRLWMTYLFTGLIFLVILLMVRQYDFVWGTTLLSDNFFLNLTNILSTPLQLLGFTTPSVEQVQATRIGVDQVLSDEYRTRWAQFLLGTLLCFGIFPRILFWLWSALMHRNARRHFTLDHYHSYFINLRQQLMPLATHGQVVDADTAPPVVLKIPAIKAEQHGLPEEAKWVAVELGQNISWPLVSVSVENDLGQIIDRDSMASILQYLQHNTDSTLAIAVSSSRPPDRGVQRIISSLTSQSKQCWLVLLHSDDEPVIESRLTAWYRLAEACDIAVDHVITKSAI